MNHFRGIVRFSLAVVLLLSLAVMAQTKIEQQSGEALPATDLERIKAGIEAPDFTLEDQDGKPVKLSR
jgi:cytochrome oxidase Cu insertion factor (SCO1/SenC/PrrC family)